MNKTKKTNKKIIKSYKTNKKMIKTNKKQINTEGGENRMPEIGSL